MGPLLLVPVFAAAVAVLVGQPETPPPASQAPVEVQSSAPAPAQPAPQDHQGHEAALSPFIEAYRCPLYNELLKTDDLPPDNQDRYVVLSADDNQKYAQVWLSDEHYGLDYEVSSRYYEFKDSAKRRYWPDAVQKVIAAEGFDLRGGKASNYYRYVRLPRADALQGVAVSMLRVMEDGFDAKLGQLKIRVSRSQETQLAQSAACRDLSEAQKNRPDMPADGGIEAFRATYRDGLYNRLRILAGSKQRQGGIVIFPEGQENRAIRISLRPQSGMVRISVENRREKAFRDVLEMEHFAAKADRHGHRVLTTHYRKQGDLYSIANTALSVAYFGEGAGIGTLQIAVSPSTGGLPDLGAARPLPQNEPVGFDVP